MASAQIPTEPQRIADQLRRFYDGPSWLGPSLKHLLSDIDEASARRRALPGAHTIWELVLHITAWFRIARERMSATKEHDPTPEEDWPPISLPWAEAMLALQSELHTLEEAILSFPEDRLREPAPAREPQLFYDLLHGVVQHSAYHAGQIALLKKEL